MKYFKFYFENGFVTNDDELYVQYKDDVSMDRVSQDCEEFFYDHISNFRYLIINSFDEEDYDDDVEDYYNEEDYFQNYIADCCYYNYYEITEEEYKQAMAEGYSCI